MIFTDLGRKGEYLARLFLEQKGFEFVRANYRTDRGEIDLVFLHETDVVFVEVKTRTYHSARIYGRGAERIDAEKQRHILYASRQFMREETGLCHGRTARYDSVEIYLEDIDDTKVRVIHTPYAFGL